MGALLATEFSVKGGEIVGVAVAGAGLLWVGLAVLRTERAGASAASEALLG